MATANEPAGAQWNAPTAQPLLDTDSPTSRAMADAPLQTSVPSPKMAAPADASGSASNTGKAPASGSRFMRRSGGGRMTLVNKQSSMNGNFPIKSEPQSINGDKHRNSSFKIKSDIDQDDRSESQDFTSASKSEKRRKSADAEGYPNPKRAKDANDTSIIIEDSTINCIPPHLTTTADGRKYSQYKASDGKLEDAHGAIIPGGYTTIAHSEKPWPCSVTDCNTSFPSLLQLGHHFKQEHRATTFHDNNDGTLTKKGTYEDKSAGSYAIVVTQEKPKIYTAGLANAINIALSEPKPDGPSADGVNNDSSSGSVDDGFEIISDHNSPQGMSHVSESRDGSGKSPNGDSVSRRERTTGRLPDLRAGPSREPHKNPAPSRSARSPSTEAPTAVDAGPAASSTATGTEVVESKNGDFSAPMPSNAAMMWDYIKQFTVVHRKDIPEKMYVRDFLPLRRLRDLQWNDAWIAAHQFKDSIPRDVSSMIMQITGPYAAEPCTRCKAGYGPYKGCVKIPPDAPPHTQSMIYGCANCVYHGGQTHCSLQAESKKEAAERFPHLDLSKLRAEVYSIANAAAGRLSAQAKQRRARASREAQMESPKQEESKAASEADESLVLVEAGISAGAEFSTRSRGAKQPNYNIKDLSRSTWRRAPRPSSAGSALPPRGALPVETVTEMAKGPEQADAGTPMGGHPERPSDRISTPDKNAAGEKNTDGGPSLQGHTARRPGVGGAAVSSGSGLASTLEMDDWEYGPGVFSCGEDGSDDVAFSSAYLVGQNPVPVADGVSCRVEFLKPGCSLSLGADARSTRLCTIMAGKVKVQIGDASFSVGFGGNIRIRPGTSAVLQNRLYIDAYLQIMSVTEMA